MCENLPYESVYFKEIMASLKKESVPVVSGALGLVNKKNSWKVRGKNPWKHQY